MSDATTFLRVTAALYGLSIGLQLGAIFLFEQPARAYLSSVGYVALLVAVLLFDWRTLLDWKAIRRTDAEARALIQRIERRQKALQRFAMQPPAIFHAACDTASHNVNDVRNRYCAHCHVFLTDPTDFRLTGPKREPAR